MRAKWLKSPKMEIIIVYREISLFYTKTVYISVYENVAARRDCIEYGDKMEVRVPKGIWTLLYTGGLRKFIW